MIEYPELSISKFKAPVVSREISSMGLAIPFQPCIQDKRTITKVLNYAIELVQIKLEESSVLFAENMSISKLKKLFGSLNYNSRCKSIAVVITPQEEKIIYLNYFADSVIFLNNHFSVLDLAGNMKAKPEFQLLIFEKNEIVTYHYSDGRLHKVYSEKYKSHFESFPGTSEMNSVVNILKAVNKTNDIPVFINGEDHLADRFYKSAPFKEIIFKISSFDKPDTYNNTRLVVAKITNHWQYWRSELIKGQIELAKRCHQIITGKENVLNVLHHWADGVLFIDQQLKQQLDNSLLNNSPIIFFKELPDQLEEFLIRGNSIEITEAGLLEEQGGIALIKKVPENVLKPFKPNINKDLKGSIF
jgi:hypothetical protein